MIRAADVDPESRKLLLRISKNELVVTVDRGLEWSGVPVSGTDNELLRHLWHERLLRPSCPGGCLSLSSPGERIVDELSLFGEPPPGWDESPAWMEDRDV